ncbi:MAG: DUF2231 domain-containing protein [Acidobacteriota bacterium]
MYTKASVARHPIHPMLIAFPVALYVATVVALLAHIGTGDPFWYRAAFWTSLGGVVMAAVAAIPGLVDLLTLPSRSRARRTGYIHAGCNVLALAAFVIACVIMGRNWYSASVDLAHLDDSAPLVLGLIGVASTLVAGALGWTLVQTHHVGVKPTTHAGYAASPEDVDDLDELIVPPPATVTMPAQPMHH